MVYPYILERLNDRKMAYVQGDLTGEGAMRNGAPSIRVYFASASFTKESG